jgi:hypothetical protein
MKDERKGRAVEAIGSLGSVAGSLLKPLLKRMRGAARGARPRLELLERITLAPRQSLALVEAEGRRFLVATSMDGGPAFYPLDRSAAPALRRSARVSW